MIESRQVPEVAVLAKRELGVGRAHGEPSADEDRDGVGAHGLKKLLAPFGKHGRSLSHRPRVGIAGQDRLRRAGRVL